MPNPTYTAKYHYQGETARGYVGRRSGSLKWRREQDLIARLLGRLPRGSSIVDVPFGTGRFLVAYATHGHVVYGLDISSDMLVEARRAHPGTSSVAGLIQGDAESLPLADGAVDYVLCTRLLNLTPFSVVSAAVSEFSRIARKGVILEVRVRRPVGWIRLIQKMMSDPRTTLHRSVHAAWLWLVGSTEPPNADVQTSYFLHDADEVIRLIVDCGLVVDETAHVDHGVDYGHRQFTPLLVMTCRKGDVR